MNAQVTLPVALGKARRAAGLLLTGGILLFCVNGSAARAADGSKQDPPTYVGSEACNVCHKDIYRAFARNPHQVADPLQVVEEKKVEGEGARDLLSKGCESCHGPGSNHKKKRSYEQPELTDDIKALRRAAEVNKACASCHSPVWAAFQRPHRHKLKENAMSCVDCHDPHGSFLPKLQKTASANEPGCLKCHGDKRGPFVFEHAPVRLEGCATCHEPHGSANPRLLTRHEVRFLCLECHSNVGAAAAQSGTLGGVPPAIHDLRSPRFRNCTICHMKVHGSQVNRALLR